jgi:hypothetical protein
MHLCFQVSFASTLLTAVDVKHETVTSEPGLVVEPNLVSLQWHSDFAACLASLHSSASL